MSLLNRTAIVVSCAMLAASQHVAAAEVHGAQQGRAHAAASHPRFQRINVIDPDREPRRVNPGWQGNRYRRWHIGDVLPPAIWAERFWMANPGRFGLDRPDEGNAWVRYGPDALLVDLNNGQVVDTVYGFNRNSSSYTH